LLNRSFKRWVSALMLPAVLAALVVWPQPSLAASGGRIGGGSFRSAPSIPRSYGGGSRSYGGGYRGGYQRGYGGGGFGFPFIVPFFFGGGGLFGFIVLMAVVGLVVNAFRGAGGGQSLPAGMRGDDRDAYVSDGPVSIAQLQVGLLASARDLQRDLRDLAASSDTSSSSGLQRVLQDSTLALLRHPDLWVYANAEVGQVPFPAAESTFNRLSMTERSKLSGERTTNVSGARSGSRVGVGDADAISDYIAVTLLVASRARLSLKPVSGSEELREALRVVGSVPSDQLLALEVIWQPDGEGEVLSADELITAYPDLKHL
jgi:uncharacterized membrane protein